MPRLATYLILCAALLAAYQPSHAQSTQSASLPMITIGTVEPLTNLDPADADDVFSWELLSHLGTGLTRQIPGSVRYELALAASETVSADGLTHTFTIKPGSSFDDGTPITAATFAASISRTITLSGAGSAIVQPTLKSATTNANSELILTLTVPTPYLDELLALPPYYAVDPAVFGASLTPAPQSLTGSGNGVYRVTTFDPGRSITLSANPAWKGTPAATPTITIRHFDDPADLRDALIAHTVDIAWRGLPADDVQAASQVKGIHVITAPELQAFYLLINQQNKPLSDPALRRSMLSLIDRDRMVTAGLRGYGSSLLTLLPPALGDPKPALFPGLDTNAANAALNKAGYSQYNRVESEILTSRGLYGDLYSSAADLLNNNFVQNAAFLTTRNDVNPQPFTQQIAQGPFDLAIIGWTPVVPHPDAILRPLLYSSGQLAASVHYSNPAVDQLLDQAALNPANAADLYDQAEAIALQDVPVVPLWESQQTLLAWDNIGGISIEPNYLLHYDQLVISGTF